MDQSKINAFLEKKQIEESLEADFKASLNIRVRRYLKVKPHPIIPYTYFSVASTEVAELFRDGHYYGCIPLAQAVAEALVKLMCEKSGWPPGKEFEKNVSKLQMRRVIGASFRKKLLDVWANRDDYHHLNPTIERDRQKLEALAQDKALLLREIEGDVFGYTVKEGRLVPKHPQYWPNVQEGQTEVYLRLE